MVFYELWYFMNYGIIKIDVIIIKNYLNMIGKIVKTSKSHGFIGNYNRNGKNIFFNYSDCKFSNKKIKKNGIVKFDILTTPKGICAKNIEIITKDIVTCQKIIRRKQKGRKLLKLSKYLKSLQNKIQQLQPKFNAGTLTDKELSFFLKYKFVNNLNDGYTKYQYDKILSKNDNDKKKRVRHNEFIKKNKERDKRLTKQKIERKLREESLQQQRHSEKPCQKRIRLQEERRKRQWEEELERQKKLLEQQQKQWEREQLILQKNELQEYYDILEIPHDIEDRKTIVKLYRKKILKVHCDKNGGTTSGAEENDAKDKIFEHFGWNR